MKQVDYTAPDGKMYAVLVPEDAPKDFYKHGIVIGPPDFDIPGIPNELTVAIHNQLHARGLFTLRSVEGRRTEIQNAVNAALKVAIVDTILEEYRKVAQVD